MLDWISKPNGCKTALRQSNIDYAIDYTCISSLSFFGFFFALIDKAIFMVGDKCTSFFFFFSIFLNKYNDLIQCT
jgi:hypothetical protein